MNGVGTATYLADPALARLWQAAHRSWCRQGGITAANAAVVRDLSEHEALTIAGLVRRRVWPTGRTAQVKLADLDRHLREMGVDGGLAQVLETQVGPLRDNRAEREDERRVEADRWRGVHAHRALQRHPALEGWLTELSSGSGAGQLTRQAGRAGQDRFELLARTLDVLAALPCDPPEGLPAFAARVARHTHALDRGRPMDVLIVSALTYLDDADRPQDAEGRRALLDRWGVVCDALSNTVLCAGLRPAGPDLAAAKLRLSAEHGAPCVLTLAELRDVQTLTLGSRQVVSVCENPEVMAAALETFGDRCPALVCVAGWPRVAALRLLRAAARGGAGLRYHGDFDWDGVRIAGAMVQRLGAALWRYDADSYRSGPDGPLLGEERRTHGLPDQLQELLVAMRLRGTAVAEEQVLDLLLADLQAQVG